MFLIVDFVSHPPAEVAAELAGADAPQSHSHSHGQVHPAQHTVAHHGFDAEDVHKYFGGAGLVDVDVLTVPGEVKMVFDGKSEGEGGHGHGKSEDEGGHGHGHGKELAVSRTIFLAKGRKPLAGGTK